MTVSRSLPGLFVISRLPSGAPWNLVTAGPPGGPEEPGRALPDPVAALRAWLFRFVAASSFARPIDTLLKLLYIPGLIRTCPCFQLKDAHKAEPTKTAGPNPNTTEVAFPGDQ